jgi:hypothetical protein
MLEHLVVAGLIYLIGVAIVLSIKPKFMFTEEGVWKEFGIGRNPATHTWMPFWLFAILWALISYILVTILLSLRHHEQQYEQPQQTSTKKMKVAKSVEVPLEENVFNVSEEDMISVKPKSRGRARGQSIDLPKGYYILNSKATEEAGGIPKYIFLGNALPDGDST